MSISRRQLLSTSSAAAAATMLAAGTNWSTEPMTHPQASELDSNVANVPFRERVKFCLNTSTVRGQQLTVPEQIKVCADAGYDAIEPWIGDLRNYMSSGGTATDLRKMLEDAGLTVPSAIGFAKWIVDDESERAAGLEEARRDMDLLRSIGGIRIAAPPIGAHQTAGPELPVIAERYRRLLELGAETGVVPQLELWGFSKTLSRLGELAYVAAEAGHPDACVLPDIYHIYKGGSRFEGLGIIEASSMKVFHVNDYPAEPERQTIADRDRVYPGDGVAPLSEVFSLLSKHGFAGTLSLELFNESYWKLPAIEVAKTGLAKMRQAVASIS
jgi:2-keto-myo-inositol isomerase